MEVCEQVFIALERPLLAASFHFPFSLLADPMAGRNFGPAGVGFLAVRAVGAFGTFDPPHCAISVNHTEITCVTAPGVGKLDWTVEVGAGNCTVAVLCCCCCCLRCRPAPSHLVHRLLRRCRDWCHHCLECRTVTQRFIPWLCLPAMTPGSCSPHTGSMHVVNERFGRIVCFPLLSYRISQFDSGTSNQQHGDTGWRFDGM